MSFRPRLALLLALVASNACAGAATPTTAPAAVVAASPAPSALAPSPVRVYPLVSLEHPEAEDRGLVDHIAPPAPDGVERLFLGPLRAEVHEGALRVAPDALAGRISFVHRCGERWVYEIDRELYQFYGGGRYQISDTFLAPPRDLVWPTQVRDPRVTVHAPEVLCA